MNRSRVLKASVEGMSARQAAARFGVGVSSAIRWIARAKIGEFAPRLQGRRRASSLDVHAVAAVLDLFTPDECANYFEAAGYEPD